MRLLTNAPFVHLTSLALSLTLAGMYYFAVYSVYYKVYLHTCCKVDKCKHCDYEFHENYNGRKISLVEKVDKIKLKK